MNQKLMRYMLPWIVLSKICCAMRFNYIFIIFSLVCISPAAYAERLVYTFNNPSFGGNPFGSNHFFTLANKQFTPPPRTSTSSQRSDAEYFAEQVQRRILSSISSGLVRSITSDLDIENDSSFEFDDLSVNYYREGGTLFFNIEDGINSIQLEFPDFTSIGSASALNIGTSGTLNSSDALVDDVVNLVLGTDTDID